MVRMTLRFRPDCCARAVDIINVVVAVAIRRTLADMTHLLELFVEPGTRVAVEHNGGVTLEGQKDLLGIQPPKAIEITKEFSCISYSAKFSVSQIEHARWPIVVCLCLNQHQRTIGQYCLIARSAHQVL
jgi:hypothetical protein